MKALTKLSSAADDVAVRPRPVPSPAAGQALVLVTATGLCGSDVHAIRGHAGYEWVSTPVTLGHEITGVVADGAGPVPVDTQVGVISMDGCRACDLCAAGRRPLCPDRTALDLLCGAAAVPADRMVSPFPLDDWAAALDAVTRGTVIKAALRP